jgi:penicillin-binding protein 3
MLNTAKKLTDLIKMDTDKITERDKKDFWIQMYTVSSVCNRHL